MGNDDPSSAAKSELGRPRRLQIFLCHASEDKPRVHALYRRLRSRGFIPWLDSQNLLPGQNWDQEIVKAVRESDVVVVCLSARAIQKSGYVQKEIAHTLDIAAEKPEATIFVIPALLEACSVPSRVNKWQYVDLTLKNGYRKLVIALNSRAKQLGVTEGFSRKLKLTKEHRNREILNPIGSRLITDPTGSVLKEVCSKYLLDLRTANNLVILRTTPGFANSVSIALDDEVWPEVVGTIAGDDAVMVIAPDNAEALLLKKKLLAFLG